MTSTKSFEKNSMKLIKLAGLRWSCITTQTSVILITLGNIYK